MDEELIFPKELSTDVKRSFFHVIECDDIESEEDLSHLVRVMFEFSDRKFYLFCLKSQGANSFILNAEQHGVINIKRTELQYYPRPNSDKNYIKIDKPVPIWEWEKEVRENSPEFIRCTIELSERWRRKLELKEALEDTTENKEDENPMILKPSMFGIGIDLHKAKKWLNRKFSKRP